MILTHIIDIDETLKLTQGQGHKVKGQGHTRRTKRPQFRDLGFTASLAVRRLTETGQAITSIVY